MNKTKISVQFDGTCLKQEKVTFTHKKLVNICIAYKTNLGSYTQSTNFALGNDLFGAFKLTANFYSHKYCYFAYGIEFNVPGRFSLPCGSGFGRCFYESISV